MYGYMKRIGLIREKKEIEYLILYVMTFLKEAIRYEDLADMAICDGGFGYFEFSDAMAELIELGHVLVTETEDGKRYALSESGRQAAAAFERRIPSSVRLEAGRSAARVYARICRNAVISTSHVVREDGTMAVRLALMDNKTPVFSFEMMVPNETQALLYEKNFRAHAEKMYDGMICVLLNHYGAFEEEIDDTWEMESP